MYFFVERYASLSVVERQRNNRKVQAIVRIPSSLIFKAFVLGVKFTVEKRF